MAFRDRVKELRRIPASELIPNPKNWRSHPTGQVDALRGVLNEIGVAGAELGIETPEGVMLIDGHARRDLAGDQELPVLILDLTLDEADKLLLLFDPVGAMAQSDSDALSELLQSLTFQEDSLALLLDNLTSVSNQLTDDDVNNAYDEYEGMPEFEQNNAVYHKIVVSFADEESIIEFAKAIGQPHITKRTKGTQFPRDIAQTTEVWIEAEADA